MSDNRYDMFALVHKGLRACMAQTLVQLGQADHEDACSYAQALDQVQYLLSFCQHHVAHEDAHVHPALERRRPGSARRAEAEHQHHRDSITRLLASVERLRHLPSQRRALPARELYRALATFIAENFAHMAMEEAEHNAVLWDCYSDEELMAIEGALVASLSAAEFEEAMQWMMTSIAHPERRDFFLQLRQAAPPEAVAANLAFTQSHLDSARWHQLQTSLAEPTH